jgi:hypothetical protein
VSGTLERRSGSGRDEEAWGRFARLEEVREKVRMRGRPGRSESRAGCRRKGEGSGCHVGIQLGGWLGARSAFAIGNWVTCGLSGSIGDWDWCRC